MASILKSPMISPGMTIWLLITARLPPVCRQIALRVNNSIAGVNFCPGPGAVLTWNGSRRGNPLSAQPTWFKSMLAAGSIFRCVGDGEDSFGFVSVLAGVGV